jgi:hypothetical protein
MLPNSNVNTLFSTFSSRIKVIATDSKLQKDVIAFLTKFVTRQTKSAFHPTAQLCPKLDES